MKKMTLVIAVEMITALQNRIEDLEKAANDNHCQKVVTAKSQPVSTRDMTIDDARRLMLGDLVKLSHRDAAEKLGLSYGQVYSARGGYTFKTVMDEKLAGPKVKALSRDI